MTNPQSVTVEGLGELGLDELTQLDLAGVAEVRDIDWPAGVYKWRVKEADLRIAEWTDKNTGTTRRVPVVHIETECMEVLDLAPSKEEQFKDVNPDDLVGRSFYGLRQPIGDDKRDLGKLKALMIDTGLVIPPEGATITNLLDQWVGCQFTAPLIRRVNRNDTSQVFTNMITRAGQVKPANGGDA